MNARTVVDARWLEWLRENLRLSVDFRETLLQLRKVGFSDEAIAAAVDAVRPTNDATEVMHAPPLLRRMPPGLQRFDSDKVDLYVYENFLTRRECERLKALIDHHLQPSTLPYSIGDNDFRTSQSSHLSHLRSPTALNIDDKICRAIGIRAAYSEGIQAQRYDVGQQFKPHWDYFEPGSETYLRFAELRGNRTWSFMIYLNEGMEGGGTHFTELGHTFQPRAGLALLWNNLLPDGTPNKFTKHAGQPVISGHKVIITKWFRAIGDGPVFHE